jgi:hypothetical protein
MEGCSLIAFSNHPKIRQRRIQMSQAIYKVWFMRYKDAWYKLSPEEQKKLMDKNEALMKEVGGELVMMCTSVWASEKWLAWGVEKYPSIEAVQKRAMDLYTINWFNYVESETSLGVEMPPM